LLLRRFKDEVLPKAGNLVELCDCSSSSAKCTPYGGLLLYEIGVFRLEFFFLLDSLAVQNGQAELQVADLAIIALALLFQAGVLFANGRELLGLGRLVLVDCSLMLVLEVGG
jgi:hypothetical protein